MGKYIILISRLHLYSKPIWQQMPARTEGRGRNPRFFETPGAVRACAATNLIRQLVYEWFVNIEITTQLRFRRLVRLDQERISKINKPFFRRFFDRYMMI